MLKVAYFNIYRIPRLHWGFWDKLSLGKGNRCKAGISCLLENSFKLRLIKFVRFDKSYSAIKKLSGFLKVFPFLYIYMLLESLIFFLVKNFCLFKVLFFWGVRHMYISLFKTQNKWECTVVPVLEGA